MHATLHPAAQNPHLGAELVPQPIRRADQAHAFISIEPQLSVTLGQSAHEGTLPCNGANLVARPALLNRALATRKARAEMVVDPAEQRPSHSVPQRPASTRHGTDRQPAALMRSIGDLWAREHTSIEKADVEKREEVPDP